MIDINPIAELRGISVTHRHIRIGAPTRHAHVER
ncbi:MAG: FAD binding domain-containing protein, partial [Proteobacteria bacterium]|nr:FAD binding domain-containing protein [Pseudomonadota bacterium]